MTNEGHILKTLRQTPKMELIVTLDKAWELLATPTPLNLALLRGTLDHARAVAKRVGNESRTPKKPTPVRVAS